LFSISKITKANLQTIKETSCNYSACFVFKALIASSFSWSDENYKFLLALAKN
jgi:hypothetical protein